MRFLPVAIVFLALSTPGATTPNDDKANERPDEKADEKAIVHVLNRIAFGPRQGDVERVRLWTEVLTGMELKETRGVRVLDATTWQKRQQRLSELGGR